MSHYFWSNSVERQHPQTRHSTGTTKAAEYRPYHGPAGNRRDVVGGEQVEPAIGDDQVQLRGEILPDDKTGQAGGGSWRGFA